MNSKTLNIINHNNIEYITFPKLESCNIVNHIFSTRLGGVSTGRYTSMNLSFNNGDSRENVLTNYRILCEAANIDISNLVLTKQTHTDNIRIVGKKDCGIGIFKPSFDDIDGLITNVPGVALVTQYADCTPLIFCDPIKKVIASSHAGWRGTAKQIGAKTVKKMTEVYGCNPSNIIACIGPCIGNCCYEVDNPVYNEFAKIKYLDLAKIFISKPNGKFMLNMVEANKQMLVHAGININNMDLSDLCTCCNSNELHSHRATNGKRGNLAAIIELK